MPGVDPVGADPVGVDPVGEEGGDQFPHSLHLSATWLLQPPRPPPLACSDCHLHIARRSAVQTRVARVAMREPLRCLSRHITSPGG